MSQPVPISVPAGFAPAMAVGYSDETSALKYVSADQPLPVSSVPEAGPALEGEAAYSGTVGPFIAVPGRIVTVTLGDGWSGEVRVLRSTDQGQTMHGLTAADSPVGRFTGAGCEQVWGETERGAWFYLELALDSGTVAYRVSQ